MFWTLSSFISFTFVFRGFIIFSKINLSSTTPPSEFDSSTIFFISVTRLFILLIFPSSLIFLYLENKSCILMNKSLYNLE